MAVSLSTYTTCNIWYGCYALTETVTLALTPSSTSRPYSSHTCNISGCFDITVPVSSVPTTSTSSDVLTTTSSRVVTSSASSTSMLGASAAASSRISSSVPTSSISSFLISTTPVSTPRPTSFSTSVGLPSSHASSVTASLSAAGLQGAGVNNSGQPIAKARTGGMSAGAIVAAVVVPIAVLALVGILVLLFLRRRRRRAQAEATFDYSTPQVVTEKPTEYYGGAAPTVAATDGASAAFPAATKAPQIRLDTGKAFPDTVYFAQAAIGAELSGDPAPPSYHSRKTSAATAAGHSPSGSRSEADGVPVARQQSNQSGNPFATPSPTHCTHGPFDTPDASPASLPPTTSINTAASLPTISYSAPPIPFVLPRKPVPANDRPRPEIPRMESKDDFLSDNEYDDGEEAEIGMAQRASVMRVPSIGSAHMLDLHGGSLPPRGSAEGR